MAEEEWLGVPLFVRGIRQIQPTPEALESWAAIQPALARIQQASRPLRERSSNTVWLSLPRRWPPNGSRRAWRGCWANIPISRCI
ncbi:hypothetical protein QU481_04425 [Crenobacter sp. SG2303]|uniref:HTH lysR-type domain-containing protein n=1 Tax=Crenobacter oryzisoli TaxID=3056844 RepID=A0ABT7XK09_9NEIS|nr:hypothetical protein [Crenobacter sp. SG2303]MDN0074133.1 hypothetical protein [Crenobacter sp. SG2303]